MLLKVWFCGIHFHWEQPPNVFPIFEPSPYPTVNAVGSYFARPPRSYDPYWNPYDQGWIDPPRSLCGGRDFSYFLHQPEVPLLLMDSNPGMFLENSIKSLVTNN